jgi:hypothetical protein
MEGGEKRIYREGAKGVKEWRKMDPRVREDDVVGQHLRFFSIISARCVGE